MSGTRGLNRVERTFMTGTPSLNRVTVIYQLEAHYIIEAHPIVRGSSQLPETFYGMKIGQFSRGLQPFY